MGDNMVLQRNQPLPIWGWAGAGEAVRVQLGTVTAKTVADEHGKWGVVLPAQEVALNLTLTVTGATTLERHNVAVGDVWLCSGQSNMGWDVERSQNARQEIAAADFPQIRLFSVDKISAASPQSDVGGRWDVCNWQTVPLFSAVGYFFGRALHQKLDVPIGLICVSWGATSAEAWTSREALLAHPQLKRRVEEADELNAAYPAALEKFEYAGEAGQIEPDETLAPRAPLHEDNPTNLFNGMIAPLIPFGIKGAIWYQGESNTGRAEEYGALLSTLITDWRTRWGEGDFPFLWVQLAAYGDEQKSPVEPGDWPLLREAQTRPLVLPRTAMASAIDLADPADPHDIHPKNKQDVGLRLASLALAIAYSQKVFAHGPMFQNAQIQGDQMRVTFKHTEGGLQARGDELKGFAVAGEGGTWQWADAKIEGDAVVLSSARVPVPKEARYNWADNPIGNLYNGAGLPATPFRTDTHSAR